MENKYLNRKQKRYSRQNLSFIFIYIVKPTVRQSIKQYMDNNG